MKPLRVLAVMMLVSLMACGPSTKEIRGYIGSSQRNHIAILPLALVPNQKNIVPQTMKRLQSQLFDLNFKVLDPRAVEKGMAGQPAITYTWPSPQTAAQIGRTLGVSAVMIGRIDRAQDPTTQVGQVTGVQQTVVVDTQGNVERVVTSPVVSPVRPRHRTISFAIRLRMVDTQTGKVYWENNDSSTFVDSPYNLMDTMEGVLERLTYDLDENYYNQKL